MRTVLAIATAGFSGLSVAWIFFGAAHYPIDRNPGQTFFWVWGGWVFLAVFCGVLWAMTRPGRPTQTKGTVISAEERAEKRLRRG